MAAWGQFVPDIDGKGDISENKKSLQGQSSIGAEALRYCFFLERVVHARAIPRTTHPNACFGLQQEPRLYFFIFVGPAKRP